MKTTILLADALPFVRASVRSLFVCHRDFQVVGESETDESAVVATARLRPDIVVMDIDLSRPGDGFWAGRRVRDLVPTTKVVFLTSRADLLSLVQAIHVGAAGYVVKGSGDHVLLSTLLGVARGRSIAETGLGPLVLEAFRTAIITTRTQQLSPKEMQILALMQRRMSNAAIAVRLGIRTGTVSRHVRDIVRKLEVEDRATAASVTPDAWVGTEQTAPELSGPVVLRLPSADSTPEVLATPSSGEQRAATNGTRG